MSGKLLLRILQCVLLCGFAASPGAGADRGFAGTVTAPDGTRPGKQWLLVIGIDEYQNWRVWPELDCAVSDAKGVRDVLKDRYHINRVEELFDGDATRTGIYGKLRWLGRNTKPNDSLMIYYAGHGKLDDFERIGFWVPVDGTLDATTWLGSDRVRRAVANMPAKHVLLISDSCFGGDFFREGTGIPRIDEAYYRRAYAKRSRQAMTSGGVEPVADAALRGHSPFAYWLIDALKTNMQRYLVPNKLFEEIKVGVARNSNQTPRVGYLHGAQDAGGEFMFFLKLQYKRVVSGEDAPGVEVVRKKVKELGWIEISLTPDDATLTVNGEGVGSERRIQREPGEYELNASKPGYHSAKTSVRVLPYGTSPVQVVLREKRRVGAIEVRCDVAGADVRVDGKSIGKTERGYALAARNITVGRHVISAKHEACPDWRKEVTVSGGRTETVTIVMRRAEGSTVKPLMRDHHEPFHVVCISHLAEVLAEPKIGATVVRRVPWCTPLVMIDKKTAGGRPWARVGKYIRRDAAELVGWMRESDILLRDIALKQEGIWQKAIVVTHFDTATGLITGAVAKNRPVETGDQVDQELTQFNIHYVYDQRDNLGAGKVFMLLGTRPEIYDPQKPELTIRGWVDSSKLFQWDTREAAEYDKETLAKGQRDTTSIYESKEDLRRILLGEPPDQLRPLGMENRQKKEIIPSDPRFPIISMEQEVRGMRIWHIAFVPDEADGRNNGIRPFAEGWALPVDPKSGVRHLKLVILMDRIEVEVLIAIVGRLTTRVDVSNVPKRWADTLRDICGDKVKFDPDRGCPAEVMRKFLGIPVRSGILNRSFEQIAKMTHSEITQEIRELRKKLFLLRSVVNEKHVKLGTDEHGEVTYTVVGEKRYWFGAKGMERAYLDPEVHLP